MAAAACRLRLVARGVGAVADAGDSVSPKAQLLPEDYLSVTAPRSARGTGGARLIRPSGATRAEPLSRSDSRGQPPGSGAWHGEVKRIGDLSEREIEFWQHLVATRSELCSPFFSIEFARAVAAAGVRARVCLLYDHRELAGFFPFQFADRFCQWAAAGERIGGALNDFCGLLLDYPRHGPIGVAELLRCAGLKSFDVSHLEQHQPRFGPRFSVTSQGARIQVGNDLETYWTAMRAAHPSDYETLRRRERKAAREYRSIDFAFADADLGRLLDQVVAAKRAQYLRTGKKDGFAGSWKLGCLKHIAGYRTGRCLPVLSSLLIDGNWAALHFGLQAGKVLHYWFPVYNPNFDSISPGLILLSKMVREAASHGIETIDLGEGLSRYKLLFATELYPIYRDFWHRASPRGLAYRGYMSLLWRVQASQKRQ
jgi:CelD/BcsL family acetyltransferase involved in cellulose biosynthesis